MDISILIPVYNEAESIPELTKWLQKVMEDHDYDYEIVFVDDGSSDTSWKMIEEAAGQNKRVKAVKFRRNYGKSAALNEGFQHVEGEVVITMDADLQDNPDEIPELFRMVQEEGYDLVSGWKRKRHDPYTKTIPSKLFNFVTRTLTGIPIHDFNCGLKAYRREVVKSIKVYGEMHRYIPVIAKRAGFDEISEKEVKHRPRQYGQTKYGVDRFLKGFLDLISLLFVTRFGKRPMHLFGTLGTLTFLFGGGVAVYLIAKKLYKIYIAHEGFREVVDQPLFYLALVAVIVGVQLFVAGFLGELLSLKGEDEGDYQVETSIALDTESHP